MTPELPQPTAAMLPQTLADDVPCAGCAYNLRGLTTNGRCPECGFDIGESLRAHDRMAARYGPSLRHESTRWMTFVVAGYVLYVIAAALWGAFPELAPRDADGHATTVGWLMILTSAQSMWLGLWWLTRRPTVQPRRQDVLRRALRVLATTWLISADMFFVEQLVDRGGSFGGRTAAFIRLWSVALSTLLGYAYLAQLSARLGNRWLRRACLFMSVASILMIIAVAEKMSGIYRPHIGRVTLPWALQPLLGSVEDFWSINELMWRWRSAGPSINTLLDHGPRLVWLACSFATLSWFAGVVLIIAVTRAGRTAPNSRP